MKKLIAIMLALTMLMTVAGCGKKEEPAVAGGWTEVKDGAITDELNDIFNKALEGLLGAKYEPVELLATQVVNGINYKFLANGTKTTNPVTTGTYNVTVNVSSDGTVSLVNIETIEEKQ